MEVNSVIKEIGSNQEKQEITNKILRSLPEWFGIEEAIVDYVQGVGDKYFLAAFVDSAPVGFASLKLHNDYTAEIYVIGVIKEYHRQGFGGLLVQKLVDRCRQKNLKLLTVKTLSSSHPDPYYAGTRSFYARMGFFPVEELKELWGEHSPCLLMAKIT